jgi:hypothetical protein
VVSLVTAGHTPRLATTCFAVAANTPFQITMKDDATAEDGNPVPMLFAIFPSKAAAVTFDPKYASYSVDTAGALFTTDLDWGPSVMTAAVNGLRAGVYYMVNMVFPAFQSASAWQIVEIDSSQTH